MDGSDAAEVARARAGDRDAFRALVERHSRKIFRLAYRMTGNEQDAEDVVQETFLRAYRRLGRFESRSNFGTWLHRIAVNHSFDLLRRRQQQGEGQRTAQPDPSNESHWPAASQPSPERLAFSVEIKQKVASVLARTSVTERAAFVLRHFEGMPIEEIGQVLGLRTSATKHSIFRAVQKLRKELAPLVSLA